MKYSKFIFPHWLEGDFCSTWSCLNVILSLLSYSHIISQLEGLILKPVGLETCVNIWENIFCHTTTVMKSGKCLSHSKAPCSVYKYAQKWLLGFRVPSVFRYMQRVFLICLHFCSKYCLILLLTSRTKKYGIVFTWVFGEGSIWEVISGNTMSKWGSHEREGRKTEKKWVNEELLCGQLGLYATGDSPRDCAENTSESLKSRETAH